MATAPERYGFVGLGNMGRPMAANMAKAGFAVWAYDKAGSAELAPPDSQPVESLAELAQIAATIFLSVPDGKVSLAIARELTALNNRASKTVVDLSTTGIAAAQAVDAELGNDGIEYIDCPVSGGAAGAKAATITAIWAGSSATLERHRPVLEAISGNIFHVGDKPGQGQAAKLLNNFLSATAMAATSEAVLFGLSQGLEMQTILDVVNVSTGRNTATSDKFVNRVLTGTFDAGFHTALMNKDVQMYLQGAQAAKTPTAISSVVSRLWQHCDQTLPGSDFTQIYNYLRSQTEQKS